MGYFQQFLETEFYFHRVKPSTIKLQVVCYCSFCWAFSQKGLKENEFVKRGVVISFAKIEDAVETIIDIKDQMSTLKNVNYSLIRMLEKILSWDK